MPKNTPRTIAQWRKIFDDVTFPWVVRNHEKTMESLLQGRIVCRYCVGRGVYGIMDATTDQIKNHAASKRHLRHKSKSMVSGRQVGLFEAAVHVRDVIKWEDSVRYLAMGAFISSGVPYSCIPALLDGDVLTLLRHLPSGVPSRKTLSETDIPGMVDMVRKEIASQLSMASSSRSASMEAHQILRMGQQ